MNDKLAMLESFNALAKGLVSKETFSTMVASRGGSADMSEPSHLLLAHSVNPQLGAAVLLGSQERDFSLPGALPLVWERCYCSAFSPVLGVRCGVLGYGWHLPMEVSLELRGDRTLILDARGRVITFTQPLVPAKVRRSQSENIWLARGGKDERGYPPIWSTMERFLHLPSELTSDENIVFVGFGSTDVLWAFAPVPQEQRGPYAPFDPAANLAEDRAAQEPPKKPPPHNHSPQDHAHHSDEENIAAAMQGAKEQEAKRAAELAKGVRWRPLLQIDRLSRSMRFQYHPGGQILVRSAPGGGNPSPRSEPPPQGHQDPTEEQEPLAREEHLPAGYLVSIVDGVGRRYRLVYQKIHSGRLTGPNWGGDCGWRLSAVVLEHDPLHAVAPHHPRALWL